MYPWIFFLLLHAEWPPGAHFGVSKILSMVWLKPRNDMRERKGEAMRVRKEPTQKRRGGVSDLSRLSVQALNAR